MGKSKWLAALAATMFSGVAAATSFSCGSVVCNGYSITPISEISDLVIDGDHFDVTFSNTPQSLFQYSLDTAAPGSPITGVDAADALNAFITGAVDVLADGPCQGCQGDGIAVLADGTADYVENIYTASAPDIAPGFTDLDFLGVYLGGGGPILPTSLPEPAEYSLLQVPHPGGNVSSAIVTTPSSTEYHAVYGVFTPIVAPAPEVAGDTAPAAVTLFLGVLLAFRGKRTPAPASA